MEQMLIKFQDFEGPFDLLLHLIKKNKMSIYNVNILSIINQYIDYINIVKNSNMDITSEFIVMVATLLEIKSKSLLPKKKNDDEDDSDEPDKTSEEVLISKLILYKTFKEVSCFLSSRLNDEGNNYFKKPEIIKDVKILDENTIFKNLTPEKLVSTFQNLYSIYVNKQNTSNKIESKIYLDKYKISDKMEYLMEMSQNSKIVNLEQILNLCQEKSEIIVTFIALLQLVKDKILSIYQESNFQKILVERIS